MIIEEGHRAGMVVQAHTTSPEALDLAIDAGLDIVTHGDISGPSSMIPEETLRKLVTEVMERAIPLKVPLEVHVGHGKTWADAHG